MNKLIFTCIAATLIAAPMASIVKAPNARIANKITQRLFSNKERIIKIAAHLIDYQTFLRKFWLKK